MGTYRRARARRGVLLLLLLGLLAMLGVVAITFVLFTSQYKRAVTPEHTGEQAIDSPEAELNRVARMVLRDGPDSVLMSHGLLDDIYGNRTFGAPDASGNPTWTGVLYHSPPAVFVQRLAGGALIEFTAMTADPSNINNVLPLNDAYRYVGCVLTFRDGPAKLQSTRIVGVRTQSGGSYVFQVLAPESSLLTMRLLDGFAYKSPQNRCRYIINGSPFSGTGAGWHPGASLAGGTLDAMVDLLVPDGDPGTVFPAELALMPNVSVNKRYWDADSEMDLPDADASPDVSSRESAGGSNEDYDAPDQQNLLLAAMREDPSNPGQLITSVPSLHRPALVRHWINRLKSMAENPNDPTQFGALAKKYFGAAAYGDPVLRRLGCRIVFRPLPKDHPQFTGSNPAYDSALGHYDSGFNPLWAPGDPGPFDWDVDNDGDGTPDSVWLDVGLPVRADPDGQLYKPLVAILCVDMDGRLNLNAHGELMQTVQGYYQPVDLSNAVYAPPLSGIYKFAGATGLPNVLRDALPLPHGLGMGPFEINLWPLFAPNLSAYRALIRSRYSDRDGDEARGAYVPGVVGDDFQSWNAWSTFGGSYWNFAQADLGGSYGSPPDFNGDAAIGLDPGGRPIYSRMGIDNEHVDDPGEFRVARETSTDSLYTLGQLEAILRRYDADAYALPQRLPSLYPDLANFRHAITTESWDLPSPNLVLPEDVLVRYSDELQNNNPPPAVRDWLLRRYPPQHVYDLLALKAYFEHRLRNTSGSLPARQQNAMTHAQSVMSFGIRLLSWDLLSGLRMDLNRPFGNGRDTLVYDTNGDGKPDKGNNVVDEPGRIIRASSGSPPPAILDGAYPGEVTGEFALHVDAKGQPVPNIAFNHIDSLDVNGDGTVNNIDRAMARQFYARHLYVLMMLLADDRHFYANPNSPTAAEDERKARTIAQWAINVVDFRDRDAIMTPFEYDIYPFTDPVVNMSGSPPVFDNNGAGNTWDVDGIVEADPNNINLLPPSGTTPYADDGQPYRGLVWGCERPELLITETLATHDFRLQDLANDNGDATLTTDTSNPDNDYDNLKRPEGSLFIELYNPWTNLEPGAAELYNNPMSGVDLAKVVVDRPDPTQPNLVVNWPVWRMIFVPGDVATAALDPDDPANWPANGGALVAERSLYFTDPSAAINLTLPPQEVAKPLTGNNANHGPAGEQFYPDVAVGAIPPGNYAVIGPGLPQAAVSGSGTDYVTYFGKRSGDPGDAQTKEPTDANQTRQVRLNVQAAGLAETPIKANTNPQAEPQAGQIRNVVSIVVNQPERLNLTEPDGGYPDTIPGATFDDVTTRMYVDGSGAPLASDSPLDAGRTDRIGANHLDPVNPPTVQARVSIAHLQRLANPLQPWHPQLNPYLTVDSSPIDLIPFNGWDNPPNGKPNPVHFASHQRGETNTSDDGTNNIWIQRLELKTLNTTANPLNDGHYFDEILSHSLGYVSSRLPLNDPAPFGPLRTTPPYEGDPQNVPFPWLAWNNRPFVSQLELLMVPVASSSRLLNAAISGNDVFFAMIDGKSNFNPYATTGKAGNEAGFQHQLNFFHSGGPGAPQWHRLLEYVNVPSRFTDSQIQGHARAFTTGAHLFYPPFHQVSNYREPGRINLNTIYDARVWNGLVNGHPVADVDPGAGPNAFQWFCRSRRGYGAGGDDMFSIDPAYPTQFARPFRSFAGRYLVPPTPGDVLYAAAGAEVDASVLRHEPASEMGGGATQGPMFGLSAANYGLASEDPAFNAMRNPSFYYKGLQRLGNLVTSRSNVYAVWLTLGYFEVEQVNRSDYADYTNEEYAAIFGDGYRLGKELGSVTGETKRHRAFYIMDRSIPVGFIRGEDLNVEKAIVLKRFIQ